MQGHPLRAYDFLRSLRKSHFHCGSGTFDVLVVLDRPFGSKDLVAEVTDRFMDLAKVRFK